ncbi:hypothetical protein [Mesorhizobium sp.]|uniref:hypothetical protein n=1 Tax=Mesorhizobium sp. TaxID=1871066 RepID=UPI00120F5878|nr:hypothetical protein [Mesorhizobium sp.]TIS91995.1 MAG: hypothetical protein E5W89_03845 [Mesorhizobium sp.]
MIRSVAGVTMEGRALTNLLLAVIAGVLLLGRDAMLSGLKGFLLVAVAIAVIWVVLSLALYLIREAMTAFHEAKDWKDVGGVLFMIALCCIGFPMLAYAGWLWLEGVPTPLNTAASSGIGVAWMVAVALLAAGFVAAGLYSTFRWVARYRSDLPAIIGRRMRLIFWGYLEFLGGPVTFSKREWRIHTEAGASPAFRTASTVFASFIGLIVAVMTVVLTVSAVIWALYGLGVVK